MLKIYKYLIIFFYLTFSLYAHSDEQKIVYLNLDYIIKNSTPGKLILQDLENKKKKI